MAPLVRTGGSRHTGLAAPPHRNIQQVYDGVVLDDNISNMAHVVGGIVGGILGFSLNKRSKYGI